MLTSIIRGPYFDDLLNQPEALLATCRSLRAAVTPGIRVDQFRRIVLTGMGSSLHALYPLYLRLCATGLPIQWMETAELLGLEGWPQEKTLVIAVSQSGESVEVVQLLRTGVQFAHVIGVTNTAGSSLAKQAQTVVQLQAGVESSVSCKTYVATLAALHWLGSVLLGESGAVALDRVEAVVAPMRSYLGRAESSVAVLRQLVDQTESVFVVGRGASLATAGTGGLILKESTRRHAEGMSSAAFRHGPLEMIGPRVLVLVLAGDARSEPLNRRLAADITEAGGSVVVVSDRVASGPVFQVPAVPSSLLPLVEILPIQMLSLALAARDGREAGRFSHASKVTIIA